MLSLLINVAIPNIIGGVSSGLSSDSREQYSSLVLPKLHPPGYIFGIVWVIIYTLMGVAAHIVLQNIVFREDYIVFFVLYGVKLFFNFAWSIIFFRYLKRGLAFVWIIVLSILIIINIFYFYQFSSMAAFLMIPYILWVLFASWLNYSIWRLNL